jgi:hypothetical protein
MKTGIELIAEERERQVSKEGWTALHDTQHNDGQLARAAACYAWHTRDQCSMIAGIPYQWPWEQEWWKPTPDDRLRELVKAGALIAAEIDRLQRLAKHIASLPAEQHR